jgi:hypothetical protein
MLKQVKALARKKEIREADLAAKAKRLVPPSVRMHAVNEFLLILDVYGQYSTIRYQESIMEHQY